MTAKNKARDERVREDVESLAFPQLAIVGSLGKLARSLAGGTEVPVEFLYACALAVFGWICSTALKLEIALDVECRLYLVLLGTSYDARKSTAVKKVLRFFDQLLASVEIASQPYSINGVGSGEGLIRELNEHPVLLLVYDELCSFFEKCRVPNSSLLAIVTSLFEGRDWDNRTKNSAASVSVRGAHLSLIGCSTIATYGRMWTPAAIAIGFLNRLFIVSADRKVKVPWPEPPDEQELTAVQNRIIDQLRKLPITFGITNEAKARWTQWYMTLPKSEHAKRLDTIGFRLLPIIALTTDKDIVDLETVETVLSILNYEFDLRRATDPIDADGTVARLEESIRRQLTTHDSLNRRELRRRTNADRCGLWAFDRAIESLLREDDIIEKGGLYRLGDALR
jgi:hypothetical protein